MTPTSDEKKLALLASTRFAELQRARIHKIRLRLERQCGPLDLPTFTAAVFSEPTLAVFGKHRHIAHALLSDLMFSESAAALASHKIGHA